MTRLPIESRLAVDRPDLPEYELNSACPITGEVTGLENHHLWPRSFGTKSWWVELGSGEIVGNRVNLSSQAHYRVTVNTARLAYDEGKFWWVEGDEWTELRWQPPKWKGETVHATDDDAWIYSEEKVNLPHVEPGHDCPTCRRRVPLPKKESSPQTRVFSTRVPTADADTFAEIVDAAAEHHGLKGRPHHRYWVLLYGATLLLQAPKGELPSG